ncbi:MAG: CHAT domain-containing tetratricopeptide repeat protein [bacterium]
MSRIARYPNHRAALGAFLAVAAAFAVPAAADYPEPSTPADSLVVSIVNALGEAERSDPMRRTEISAELRDVADSLGGADESGPAARALQAAGWSDLHVGELDRAREALDRAERFADASEDSTTIESVLNTSAIVFAVRNAYGEAIPRWERVLAARRARGDRRGEAQVLGNLANAYSLAGDLLEARRRTEEALVLDREIGNDRGISASNHRLASILRNLGRFDAALACADSAVAMDLRAGRDPSVPLGRLATIQYDAGRYEEGLRTLDRADSAAAANGAGRFLAANRGNRLLMLCGLGRADEAVRIGDSLDLSSLSPLDRVLYEAMYARALIETGNVARAESLLVRSIDEFEALRRGEAQAAATSLFDRAGEIYAALASVRLAHGRVVDAWGALERGRSATLRDQLELGSPDLASVQATIAAAGPAALVEFSEPLNGVAAVFVITGDAIVSAHAEVPSRPELARVQELLATGSDVDAVRSALAPIGQALFSGVVASLPADLERLYLVPSVALAGLPLEAMPLPGRDGGTLGERYAVSYLPASWLLPVLAARPAPATGVLVFADPETAARGAPEATTREDLGPLPYARQEARAIAPGVAEILVGPEATASAFLAAAPHAVLHFATHAVLEPLRPERSGLALAGPDSTELVTAATVETRPRAVDLVTLSGCETAGGWNVLGEGTLGLPRAFLVAGARSVVSSLWDVDDAAAAHFMERFYHELRTGAPRDVALRTARLALAAEGYSPRDCSAFVLTGLGHTPVAALEGIGDAPGLARRYLLPAFGGIVLLFAVLALSRWRRS